MKVAIKLNKYQLHKNFIEALEDKVLWCSDLNTVPLKVDLMPPLPNKITLYIYNATGPPGGRTIGEHKIQLIAPGQKKGEEGNFDRSEDRIVILAGYQPEEEVFILWDAGYYPSFVFSRNVQVRSETIAVAHSGKIGKQKRKIRGMKAMGEEVVLTATAKNLDKALIERKRLIIERLLRRGN